MTLKPDIPLLPNSVFGEDPVEHVAGDEKCPACALCDQSPVLCRCDGLIHHILIWDVDAQQMEYQSSRCDRCGATAEYRGGGSGVTPEEFRAVQDLRMRIPKREIHGETVISAETLQKVRRFASGSGSFSLQLLVDSVLCARKATTAAEICLYRYLPDAFDHWIERLKPFAAQCADCKMSQPQNGCRIFGTVPAKAAEEECPGRVQEVLHLFFIENKADPTLGITSRELTSAPIPEEMDEADFALQVEAAHSDDPCFAWCPPLDEQLREIDDLLVLESYIDLRELLAQMDKGSTSGRQELETTIAVVGRQMSSAKIEMLNAASTKQEKA